MSVTQSTHIPNNTDFRLYIYTLGYQKFLHMLGVHPGGRFMHIPPIVVIPNFMMSLPGPPAGEGIFDNQGV